MNMILLGMPLSGKTTIGKIISQKLSLAHIDLDEKIENAYGESVYDLFIKFGENKFRDIEHEHLKKINMTNHHVLSLGGGAANDINKDIISLYPNRIWLRCPLQEIIKRHEASKIKRPLLHNTNNLLERLNSLYKIREINFNDFSNISIDTSIFRINQIADKIVMEINEQN